jgi:hypothetical protein
MQSAESNSNASVHFVGGEKGGVGKSLTARVLAQYFIDKNLPFKGYDTDKSHGTFMRFYSGYASPVVIDRYEALDAVIETAAHAKERVLLDLAAQSFTSLANWMDDSDVANVASEIGLNIVYWHVMDAGRDSVDLLRTLLQRFSNRLRLIVVLNEVRGGEFEMLKASGLLDQLNSHDSSIVRVRKLSDETLHKIDQFNTSFWAASQSTENGVTGLAMFERQRVKIWLQRIYEQLDTLSL